MKNMTCCDNQIKTIVQDNIYDPMLGVGHQASCCYICRPHNQASAATAMPLQYTLDNGFRPAILTRVGRRVVLELPVTDG